MKKILIASFCLLLCLSGYSIDETKYNKIYNRFKDLPSATLDKLGEDYFKRGVPDSALVCFSIISGRYTPDIKEEESQMYAHAYNRCGALYNQYSTFDKGLTMLLKALEITETNNNEAYVPWIYNNIANVYYAFKDFKTAENYLNKGYEIAVKYKDQDIQRIILINMTGINRYFQEYTKAKKNMELLNSMKPTDQSTLKYYYCMSNGSINVEDKKYPEAIEWFKKSLQYADSCYDREKLRYAAYSNMARAFMIANNLDSAIYYLNIGKKIITSNQYSTLLFECYKDFSEIYAQKGDEKRALEYKKKYLDIADSIFSLQTFGEIKDIQFLHEMDKIEKQVYRLTDTQLLKDNQIKMQQRILLIIIGVVIIIVILLVIMYFQNKKLREANVELFNKNLEIIQSEENQKKSRIHVGEPVPATPAAENANSIPLPEAMEIEKTTEKEEDADELKDTSDKAAKYQSSTISKEEKQRIRESIEKIMDNSMEFCSVDFNLEKLSTLVNSKSKYVSQVINETYQKNFNVFINEYRIKEARKRLTDIQTYGNYTIASIATSVGFKSNANFNLIFKKLTGMTPSVYQEMAKKHQEKS